MPIEFVRAQIDAVLGDMGAHAVKTGMLPSEEVRIWNISNGQCLQELPNLRK